MELAPYLYMTFSTRRTMSSISCRPSLPSTAYPGTRCILGRTRRPVPFFTFLEFLEIKTEEKCSLFRLHWRWAALKENRVWKADILWRHEAFQWRRRNKDLRQQLFSARTCALLGRTKGCSVRLPVPCSEGPTVVVRYVYLCLLTYFVLYLQSEWSGTILSCPRLNTSDLDKHIFLICFS